MRSRLNKSDSPGFLYPHKLFSDIKESAPPVLKKWISNHQLNGVILKAIQPLIFTLEDGNFRPNRVIFHSYWGDPDHTQALSLIRGIFAIDLQSWLHSWIMRGDSRITPKVLEDRLVELFLAFQKDGYGGRAIEGNRLVPAIKVDIGGFDYATVESIRNNQVLFRVWTDHNTYSGDMPLSDIIHQLPMTDVKIAVLGSTDSYSEGSGGFHVMRPLIEISIPKPVEDKALRSQMVQRSAKDVLIETLKKKGWRYTVGDQEVLTHPDDHFQILIRERAIRNRYRSRIEGGGWSDASLGDLKGLVQAHGGEQGAAQWILQIADQTERVKPPEASEGEVEQAKKLYREATGDQTYFIVDADTRYGFDDGLNDRPMPVYYQDRYAQKDYKAGHRLGEFMRERRSSGIKKILTRTAGRFTLTWREGEGVFVTAPGLDGSSKFMRAPGIALNWSPQKGWMASRAANWSDPESRLAWLASRLEQK